MTFFVERFNGERWTALMSAQHQVGPSDLRGPDELPPANSPGNFSAFAGKPGWQARVRCDDTIVEIFEWAKVPENPTDPESNMLWGWKSIIRNYAPIKDIVGPLSFLG